MAWDARVMAENKKLGHQDMVNCSPQTVRKSSFLSKIEHKCGMGYLSIICLHSQIFRVQCNINFVVAPLINH